MWFIEGNERRREIWEVSLFFCFFTAWVAGVGHEVEGLLKGQPWSEVMMDLYNNAIGRAAGRAGVPVDPSKLQVSPQNSHSISSYPGGGCQRL